ncbi:peptide chain release factor N(5)-glutamine methyltransferase [Yoonia sp. MH D7]
MTPEAAAIARLRAAGFENAAREVRLLWGSVVPYKYGEPDAEGLAAFENLVVRRLEHEPISHLLGYRDFYDHRFFVTADVLDPRPDTETLVAACLALPFSRVLDLGTGSGCILLSLLAARDGAKGIGVDYSRAALDVAARNVAALDLSDRAGLVCSDWFEKVEGEFDLIVSNPPYIAADEMAGLQREVQMFEPQMALTDGADGFLCYRAIVAGFDPYLRSAGWLAVEIGPTQGQAVSRMMVDAGLQDVRVIADLDRRDRVVLGQKTA